MAAAAQKALGLACANGGNFYICENNSTEFIGCCTSNPCNGTGKCPTIDLRPATFHPDMYEKLPTQDCDNANSTHLWYTCKFNVPPFVGCCSSNPCAQQMCPREDLVPAKLSGGTENRKALLTPTVSIPSPTPSISLSSSSPTSPAATGLSAGAIAGIVIGVGAAFIILVALLMYKFGWSACKRRERDKTSAVTASASAPPPLPMVQCDHEAAYHDNDCQPSPYRGHSLDMHGQHFPTPTATHGVDTRQLSPAYSGHYPPHHGWSHSGGLEAVHEIDSTQLPQELDSDHGAPLYQPYVRSPPSAEQQQQQQQPNQQQAPDSNCSSTLASPRNLPMSGPHSEAEAAGNISHNTSPVGSPLFFVHGSGDVHSAVSPHPTDHDGQDQQPYGSS